MGDGPTTIDTDAELAAALAAALDTATGWWVVGTPGTGPSTGAVGLRLGEPLSRVRVVGDGLVEVGGGVSLATLAQYVQSQTGRAPGWPVGDDVTVGGALAATTDVPTSVAAVVTLMSKALVEVEVVRASTRATEVWPRTVLRGDDPQVDLPDDAVVVRVLFSLADAATAMAAARESQPGRGGVDGG